jgi:flagellar FliL protein
MSDTPTTEEEPIVPPKKSLLIPMVVGVNTLAVLGLGAMFLLKSPAHAAPAKEAAAHEGTAESKEGGGEGGGEAAPSTVRLADFVIRLRDPEVDRYARVTFELAVGGEADKTRINTALPQLRDAFITYLSDRTLEELRGRVALEQVKKDLTTSVETIVPQVKLRGLYITDFVIQ